MPKTVQEVLEHLEANYKGIRFRMIDEQNRIRQHIKIFVNQDSVEQLSHPVDGGDTVHIICALSGG